MPLPAVLGATLVSGGTGLAQGLLNNASSRRQNHRNVQNWHMQNEYNHPKAQMERLKEAGLNPALMYGQSASGATGTAGSVDGASTPKWEFDNPMNKLNMFADIKQRNAQTDNLLAQRTVIHQEAALKSAQTASTLLQNASKKMSNTVQRELVQSSIDAQKETTRQLELQTIGLQIDNMVKSQSAAQKIKQEFYKASNLAKEGKNIDASTSLRLLEAELKRSGLENAPYWARWIYRNIPEIDFDGALWPKDLKTN